MREHRRQPTGMRTRAGLYAAATAVALAAVGCTPQPITYATGPKAMTTADGLHRVAHPKGRADLVLLKPGVDLRTYHKILLEPVAITYKSARTADGRRQFALSETMRHRLHKAFQQAFESEMSKTQFYTLTDEPGPDVIRIRAWISDLILHAQVNTNTANTMYSTKTGEMTLTLELSDSATGEVLARLSDHKTARNAGGSVASPAATVYEHSAMQRRFKLWALLLRRRLDEVRELPPLVPPAPATG